MWGRGGDHRRDVTWCCWGAQIESSLHRPGVLGPRLPARRGLGSPRPPPGGAQAPPSGDPRAPGSVCWLLCALRPLAEPPVLPGRLPPFPRSRLFLSKPRGTCRNRWRWRSSAERPRYQTPAVVGPPRCGGRVGRGRRRCRCSFSPRQPPRRPLTRHRGSCSPNPRGASALAVRYAFPARGLALARGPPPCDPKHYGS